MKKTESSQPVVGRRYGHWLITADASRVNGDLRYPCRCDCGEERLVSAITLRNGTSTSCGCMRGDRKGKHADPDLLPTPPEIQRIFDLISQGILPPADQFTSKEGEPTWSFAAIAKIIGVSKDEFRELLQGVGPRFENEALGGAAEFQAMHAASGSFQHAEPA
ncbi:MAG: hypothetical protein RLZ25_1320 [Pseudomonadota bacterium]|jgi:hypothetical protein